MFKIKDFTIKFSNRVEKRLHKVHFVVVLELPVTSHCYQGMEGSDVWKYIKSSSFTLSFLVPTRFSFLAVEDITSGSREREFGVLGLWHSQRSNVPRGPELSRCKWRTCRIKFCTTGLAGILWLNTYYTCCMCAAQLQNICLNPRKAIKFRPHARTTAMNRFLFLACTTSSQSLDFYFLEFSLR